MSVSESAIEISWCPAHQTVNTQCCGGPREVWGFMEEASTYYKQWKGGTANVQD